MLYPHLFVSLEITSDYIYCREVLFHQHISRYHLNIRVTFYSITFLMSQIQWLHVFVLWFLDKTSQKFWRFFLRFSLDLNMRIHVSNTVSVDESDILTLSLIYTSMQILLRTLITSRTSDSLFASTTQQKKSRKKISLYYGKIHLPRRLY